MKILVIIIALLSLAILIYFFGLGYISKSKTAMGLVSGELASCPAKPNCVCSEAPPEAQHYIAPISLSNANITEALQTAKIILQEMGGVITTDNNVYIAAIFTSSLFGFVDDFEIRLDEEKQLMHIRSASRVGYSDMGANKKRALIFKDKLVNK